MTLRPKTLVLALLPAIVVIGLVAADKIGLREKAKAAAANYDLSCVSLSDPTEGANPMPEEHHLLRDADPEGERYFLSHHVTVTPLDGVTYRRCFGQFDSNNPVGTNFIFLNLDRLQTPALRATAISHELVHVQHSDPTSALGQHTLLYHLWRPEEAEAHLRGLTTAKALHSPLMYAEWQDRLVWIDTLPLFYGLLAANLALLLIAFQPRPKKSALLAIKGPPPKSPAHP